MYRTIVRKSKMHWKVYSIVALALLLSVSVGVYLNQIQPFGLSTTSPIFPIPKSPTQANTIYTTSNGGIPYTMTSLEGLVNRQQARLFITQNSVDTNTWLPLTMSWYGVSKSVLSSSSALSMFQSVAFDSSSRVKLVVFGGAGYSSTSYSMSPPWIMQLNIAETLAGINSALVVYQGDLTTVQNAVGTTNIIYNVANMCSGSGSYGSGSGAGAIPGGCQTTGGCSPSPCVNLNAEIQGYTWLWNLVKGSVSHQIFSMNPEGRAPITDYTIENKAFTFEFCCGASGTSLSASQTGYSNMMNFGNTILSSLPRGIPDVGYIGFGGEVPSVSELSTWGDYEIPGGEASNLSYLSGLPTATNLAQANSALQTISYTPGRTYIMTEFTQGDALMYDFYNNYATGGGGASSFLANDPNTQQPYRNEIPASWQINPIMAVIAPTVLRGWFSAQQGSLDDFMTSPSGGGGYDHPSQMPNHATWGATSHTVSFNSDMGIYFVIDDGMNFYGSSCTAPLTTTNCLQAMINDFNPKALLFWNVNGQAPRLVSGIPVMTATCWVGNQCAPNAKGSTFTGNDVSSMISFIQNQRSGGNNFIYIAMNAQNPGLPFISALMNSCANQLSPCLSTNNYQFVNAQNFVDMYLASQGKPPIQQVISSLSITPALPLSVTTYPDNNATWDVAHTPGTLTLANSSNTVFQVYDTNTGAPVQGSTITLVVNDNTTYTATTDVTGTATFNIVITQSPVVITAIDQYSDTSNSLTFPLLVQCTSGQFGC